MGKKEGNAAAAAAAAGKYRDASPVIVLPAGSAAARQPQHRSQQREKDQQPATGVVRAAADFFVEPPEKVFYKTRLCEKFESGGRCAYEDGCTFAHGHAELRPPLPLPPAARRSRLVMPPVVDGAGEKAALPPFHYFGVGKVCFEYRDKGTCHFGDKCNYAHASAAVHPADMRHPKPPEPAMRSVTPPGRAFSAGSGSYAPVAARACPLAGAEGAEQGEVKPTRLELLSRKKLSGIYGDWPEES